MCGDCIGTRGMNLNKGKKWLWLRKVQHMIERKGCGLCCPRIRDPKELRNTVMVTIARSNITGYMVAGEYMVSRDTFSRD